jgi:hypothetical protein
MNGPDTELLAAVARVVAVYPNIGSGVFDRGFHCQQRLR